MSEARVCQWVADAVPADVKGAIQRLVRDEDVQRVAVMPDVHLSKEVCVGLAVATRSTLIPAAVGGDIGCGMAAIAFEGSSELLSEANAAGALLKGLYEAVPIMRHRRREGQSLRDDLQAQVLSDERLEAIKAREGPLQFGTLGRGNHFLEFQSDETGRLWLMVHSGSRGMGQAIREHHERRGRKNRAGLRVLDIETPQGQAYLNDVDWALRYANGNRRRMIDLVTELMRELFGIDADESSLISCHHNFVRQEHHFGEASWVHRKGAISAEEGEPGIIPGSMGTYSFLVQGRGCAAALRSSSHGAGRCMSRTVARRRISSVQLRDSMNGVWFDHRLSGRLVEEAPDAYKDIGAVMRAQKELTKPIRRLCPLLAFKGG